jgi:gluconate 2-dehydrogenase alpha chain
MKVIGLERGPRLATEDFTPHDELRFFQRQDLRPNVKRQPVRSRPNAKARATSLPVLNYGNQAGGGTVHHGSVSWRFYEDDFRARSHTIERYGASVLPQDSSLSDADDDDIGLFDRHGSSPPLQTDDRLAGEGGSG